MKYLIIASLFLAGVAQAQSSEADRWLKIAAPVIKPIPVKVVSPHFYYGTRTLLMPCNGGQSEVYAETTTGPNFASFKFGPVEKNPTHIYLVNSPQLPRRENSKGVPPDVRTYELRVDTDIFYTLTISAKGGVAVGGRVGNAMILCHKGRW